MEIAVVIVNYNVKYYVEQCIRSVFRASKGLRVAVYVVDNCSSDGSIDYLSKRFPTVHFMANKTNSGFSSANNLAIKYAQSDYVALVNPDTLLSETVFRDCLELMHADAEVGGIGVKMFGADGSFAYESRRGFPSPATSFYKITGLSQLFPYSKRFGRYYMRFLDKNAKSPIDILSGAFMFLRRKTLNEVGLLDEQFFMYGEDVDLSYRITKGGYKNYYLPTPILHYKGESTKKNSTRYVKVFYQAMLIFFRKHFPHYTIGFSLLIKMAIYMRAAMALVKRAAGFFLTPKKEVEPRFIVLGSKAMIHQVRELCKRNQLTRKHSFVVASERTAPNGPYGLGIDLSLYTHVVYEMEQFSMQSILQNSAAVASNLVIGTYSQESFVLILPNKVYT